jgi:hypothetical protein
MQITQDSKGTTAVEMLFVVSLLVVVCTAGVPPVLDAVAEVKTMGAVRYLSARMQRARMEAIARNTDTALRFRAGQGGFTYATYVDGNGNGVRTADIDSGLDIEIVPPERLADKFPGVEIATLQGLPPIDPGGTPPGADPVRFGASDMLTFSPRGTSTPGTLYVRGPAGSQFAIRVFAETGKVRLLRFVTSRRTWVQP